MPHAVHGPVHVRGPVAAPVGSSPSVHGPIHMHGPVAAPEHAPVPQSPGPLLASSTVLP